jgi:hypothetical protein
MSAKSIQTERRRSKRITVSLKAERISGGSDKAVFIENISEQGIQIMTGPGHSSSKYPAGTELELKLHLPSGEKLSLSCTVKWSYQESQENGSTSNIGMVIIDPPKEFRKFVKSLH